LSEEHRDSYIEGVRADYVKAAETHARSRSGGKRTSIAQARSNSFKPAFDAYAPVAPSFLGTKIIDDVSLEDLASAIDWTPFFSTWEIKGTYPAVLTDNRYGPAATALFDDARRMLDEIVRDRLLTPKGVVGFWPAARRGDDIVLFEGEDRARERTVLHTLRQQMQRGQGGRANLALADFVAGEDSGIADYLGGFAVTAGHGEDELVSRHVEAGDDYNKILAQALSDRLAEAFAERLHERVRKTLWGYAPKEDLSVEDLIAERYQGIRPAPGYPAQPDHTEKATLFDLMDAPNTAGITLTESYAMWPGSSVSGLYFAHPESHYFGVGRIERDQVEDYALRKGWDLATAERWLAPILNYDPVQREAAE
jgi:5-methyltetrahydrofolate--homocysteine methyltransferase